DDSFDFGTADLMDGIASTVPGESVIYVIGAAPEVTTWHPSGKWALLTARDSARAVMAWASFSTRT
ncbi:MAG: hypothetical protein AAGJ79_09745, partial [Verrucomicrobiota bacterium]